MPNAGNHEMAAWVNPGRTHASSGTGVISATSLALSLCERTLYSKGGAEEVGALV